MALPKGFVLEQQNVGMQLPAGFQLEGSNIINTDVPTVVGQTPAPTPTPQPKRTMMDRVKALYEVPLTVGSAMVAGPVSSAYGVYKSATSPEFGTPQNVRVGQQAANQLAQRMTYTPTSPVTQEVLEDVGQAVQAAKLPPIIPTTGMIPSYARMAAASQPVVREAAQTAQQTVQPATSRMASALRITPSEQQQRIKSAPSTEELAARSSQLFKQAKESNVELNAKDFSNTMKTIGKELREEGYDPRLYPKLDVAFSELQNAKMPKDFNELRTLRKFIQGAQKSADPEERRLATDLKSRFDDYVMNIPETSIKTGGKEGLQAWKEARDVYSRMSKSEMFDEMLDNAQLDRSKFSMSGIENSLAQQLRQLAKNDKKMRMFTAEEQKAIRSAAEGGNVQNVLRLFGKFAPTSSVSSIPSILTTALNAPLGLALTGGAIGSRYAASQMRKSDVKKLAALMRAGAKKKE
ncbi:MAG: hypothetical protein WCG15_03135 [Actinomycetes bacterium]